VGDCTGMPFIDQIFRRFKSACVIENSLSIRCALARRFLLFSESSDMAVRTVETLGDHMVAHLQEIHWETSPPELWDLVELLQTCKDDLVQKFCKSLHDSIAEQIHCWSSDPLTRRYAIEQIRHFFSSSALHLFVLDDLHNLRLFDTIILFMNGD
jgi:hypothetical protein